MDCCTMLDTNSCFNFFVVVQAEWEPLWMDDLLCPERFYINKGCVTWVIFVFTALGIVLDPFALHATCLGVLPNAPGII